MGNYWHEAYIEGGEGHVLRAVYDSGALFCQFLANIYQGDLTEWLSNPLIHSQAKSQQECPLKSTPHFLQRQEVYTSNLPVFFRGGYLCPQPIIVYQTQLLCLFHWKKIRIQNQNLVPLKEICVRCGGTCLFSHSSWQADTGGSEASLHRELQASHSNRDCLKNKTKNLQTIATA